MPGHDIIVVGASAGGVEALSQLVVGLPVDLPAAVFVVLHIPPTSPSVLPLILTRKGPLPARHPTDGEAARPGQIYVAPPDYHLMFDGGLVRLSRGPSENAHRPAIDVLFRSAARAYGPRVIGVVLSGMLDDGTAGLQAIKRRGGLAVVQDPHDAFYSSMPQSAIGHVTVDQILPVAEIGAALATLAGQPVSVEGTAVPDEMRTEVKVAEMDADAIETPRPGVPSGYTCPECHGALWEVQDGELIRYRCRVGHAYSTDTLIDSQLRNLEDALWIALRSLEESAALAERMAGRARERNKGLVVDQYQRQAADARHRAAIVREALRHRQFHAQDAPADPHRIDPSPAEPSP